VELKTVLHIDGLDFQFETRALFTRFTLRLGAGVTWLRGANGAGKTTLLKLAGGALAPLAGSIRLDGIDRAKAALAYLRGELAQPARLARQCILLTSHVEPGVALAGTVELAAA
jgi:ABC-type bacteriocin/lantibiotic exporter with double-glycine peptidase domain